MKALAGDIAVELADCQHQGARPFGDTYADSEELVALSI